MSATAKRKCIGCERNDVVGRTYCRRCKARLARDLPLDDFDEIKYRESRKLGAPDVLCLVGQRVRRRVRAA